ncbi:MAG: hypothetical protein ACMG6E_09555, partial [Candidatus Roizmanbacteria bacterium]
MKQPKFLLCLILFSTLVEASCNCATCSSANNLRYCPNGGSCSAIVISGVVQSCNCANNVGPCFSSFASCDAGCPSAPTPKPVAAPIPTPQPVSLPSILPPTPGPTMVDCITGPLCATCGCCEVANLNNCFSITISLKDCAYKNDICYDNIKAMCVSPEYKYVSVPGCYPSIAAGGGTNANACFHETTQIDYRGRTYSLSQLKEHTECHIPHMVKTNGVRLDTNCHHEPLRLTNMHLVFTTQGLTYAKDLRIGSVIFSNLAETRPCHVANITTEV